MTADDLIEEMEGRGVNLRRMGDQLNVDAPRGVVTDTLRQDLQVHKEEILSLLRQRRMEKADRLIRDRGYLAVENWPSDGEIVLFVRDESVIIPVRWHGRITYTLAELAEIRGLDQGSVRRLHEIKQIFGGVIVDPDATSG